ncbi:hypothetical protein QAD02_008081 [Eretmocerus hayati]|uniref:Uncharacterized protein n=1 Tax=Eretmocerus hayati TaxID=131215 RepID=A0ACC2N5U9_9HYME|nr:hypothetical protein QAD02_008081 [Eretmocerus hayati]
MNLPIVDSRSGTDLRKIPDELWKLPNIGDEILICTTCQRDLQKYEPDSKQESTPQSDKPDSQGSTSQKVNVTQSIDCMLGGRPSSDASVGKRVIEFYSNDENSRQLPGKEDVKSVVQKDGGEHPEDKVSISRFFTSRQKRCVVTSSSGTHEVCVCPTHENVKLMIGGCEFESLFKDSECIGNGKPSFEDLLQEMISGNPTKNCYKGKSESCPSIDATRENLERVFEGEEITEINHPMWVSTDRCTIANVTQDVDDFLNSLMSSFKKLLLHDYIGPKQAKSSSSVNKNLKRGEFAVIEDFAENYPFLVQRSAPGFHWNNDQATLLVVTIFYSEEDGSVAHISLVCISDCLKHDAISVSMYRKKLIEFLEKKFGEIKKSLISRMKHLSSSKKRVPSQIYAIIIRTP